MFKHPLDVCLTFAFIFFCATPQASNFAAPILFSRDNLVSHDGFYYTPSGIGDDYPPGSMTKSKVLQDLEVANETGAKFLRVGISWDLIETTAPLHGHPQYDWRFWDILVDEATRHGITLMPYLCYTPQWLSDGSPDYWRLPPRDLNAFARFAGDIVKRYANKVGYWELWNEPDNLDYWLGDSDQLAAMVIPAAIRIKQVDPRPVVILGGMARGRSPFIEKLVQKFHILDYFNVVNIHGYFETWYPLPAEKYIGHLSYLFDLIHKGLHPRPLWLSEFGYSDFSPGSNKPYDYEHTPTYQAVSLWKHHILAQASDTVSFTSWYRIHDLPQDQAVIGDQNNFHLGIIGTNGEKKPAYFAFQFYNKLFNQPARHISDVVVFSSSPDTVAYAFEMKDGSVVLTGWLRGQKRRSNRLNTTSDSRTAIADVQLSEHYHFKTVRFFDEVGEDITHSQSSPELAEEKSFHQLTHLNLVGAHPLIAVLKP